MFFKRFLWLLIVLLPLGAALAQEVSVFGQPDFSSNAVGHDASSLSFPLGVAVDSGGGLYVADRNNHRVLYYAADGDATADRVYGQHGNFNSYIVNYDGVGGSGAPSADTLSNPTYVALDSTGGLYIADRDNHRVLYYGAGGDTTADRVYGQFGSFTLNVTNNDGSGLISGAGVPSADNLGVYALTIAVDSSDGLYISDSSNHRVLYFAPDGDTTADRVYGQFGSFTSNAKNNDGTGQSGAAASADSLNFPRGIVFDASGGIYVADRDNHRVLYFAPDGDTTADRVYGQAGGFTSNLANFDGSASGSPSADSLATPRALALDSTGGIYVADAGNSRVLYFAADGDTTADWVFGQFDNFNSGAANNDGSGGSGQPIAENLSGIQALTLAGGKLYLSDTGNNRVLVIPAPFS